MSRTKVPAVKIVFEVKTYSWPNTPCVVFNPAPGVFLPMIKRAVEGGELLTMHPDVPVCPTLDAAREYHEQMIQQAQEAARKAAGPALIVPPGRGRLQA